VSRADTWQSKQGPIVIPKGLGLRTVDLKLDVREPFTMAGSGTLGPTLGCMFSVHCLRRISNQATDLEHLGTLVCPRVSLPGECLGDCLKRSHAASLTRGLPAGVTLSEVPVTSFPREFWFSLLELVTEVHGTHELGGFSLKNEPGGDLTDKLYEKHARTTRE